MESSLSPILLDLGQGGYRLIMAPASVAQRAKDYQMQFDAWLHAPETDHGYWRTGPDRTPALCYDGAEAFVKWLNEYVLDASGPQAYVVPTLYF